MFRLFELSVSCAVLFAVLYSGVSVGADGPAADFVFKNGSVYTVNPKQSAKEAVAVQGKGIVYVGDDKGAERFVGPKTKVIDLQGKMLMPGFIESHIHLTAAALTPGVDLQYDTREEVLNALKDYAPKAPKKALVRGFGWRYCAFPATGPTKADLDPIFPDRPVILLAIDGHSAWANSKALQMAGITKDSKDPLPGFSYFQKDPRTSEPTGYLVEVPALLQVMNAIEPLTTEFVAQEIKNWLPKAAAAGITSVFDAGFIVFRDPAEGFKVAIELEKQGKLPIRVAGCYYYNDPKEDPLPTITDWRKRYQTELVRFLSIKFNLDGGDAQYTAAMLQPYTDKPETRGATLIPPDRFKMLVQMVDKQGFDIHVHSFGDAATRLCLDAIEETARLNGPRDRRPTFCHLILVDPKDVPRFGKLGCIGQFSIQWAAPDLTWKQVLSKRWGPERANRLYAARAILEKGGRVTFGTDWAAAGHYSTYKPLEAIQIGMTRQELGKPDGPILEPKGERLSLEQLLKGYTLDGAYQLRLEKEVGSLEVGKRADLIVLEKDLFKIEPHQIAKTKVLLTMMNGRVTHRDENFK